MSVLDGGRFTCNLNSEVVQIIMAFMVITRHIRKDPTISIAQMVLLIKGLKHALFRERLAYSSTKQLKHNPFMERSGSHSGSGSCLYSAQRRSLESLHKLILFLDSNVKTMEQIMYDYTNTMGPSYVKCWLELAITHHVGKTQHDILSRIQSWLDEQCVQDLSTIVGPTIDDDEAQVKAMSSFEAIVHRGYNASIQETILLCGLAGKLATLLKPNIASWDVQKQTAFTIIALLPFNKDVFVSLLLMAKVVKNIFALMDTQPDENVLLLLCVLRSMLMVGHAIVVEEISRQNGVPKIVSLLNRNQEALQHVAFDCILELVYNGRMEVLQKVFESEIVKNLVMLHDSYKESWNKKCASLGVRTNGDGHAHAYPFANALIEFAQCFVNGLGLRKQEKRALKEVFLRQVKEIVQDKVEVANITIEIWWCP